MKALAVTAAGAFIFAAVELHRPGGAAIFINPREVTSLRQPQASGHFAPAVHCLIYLSNGNFVTVTETCREALEKLSRQFP